MMVSVVCFSVTFSLELRELEAKLKAAYLNKDRAAQIAEKEVLMFETKVGILLFQDFKNCFQCFKLLPV